MTRRLFCLLVSVGPRLLGRGFSGPLFQPAASNFTLILGSSVQFVQDYFAIARSTEAPSFVQDIDPSFSLNTDKPGSWEHWEHWERALINLFLNAAEAGASRVTIQARRGRVDVSHDGRTAELLERISQQPCLSNDLALNFFVVRTVLEREGCTISVRSSREGLGVVFKIARLLSEDSRAKERPLGIAAGRLSRRS